MSKIPIARKRVAALQYELELFQKKTHSFLEWALTEITTIRALMVREHPTRRAAPKARLTLSQARAIRRYAKRHPKASMQAIATAVGIANMGRVSEVLSGKRFPEK